MDKPWELSPLHFLGLHQGKKLNGKRGQEKTLSYMAAFKRHQGLTYESECQEQVPASGDSRSISVLWKARWSLPLCIKSLTLRTVTWAGTGHSGKPEGSTNQSYDCISCLAPYLAHCSGWHLPLMGPTNYKPTVSRNAIQLSSLPPRFHPPLVFSSTVKVPPEQEKPPGRPSLGIKISEQ